MATFSADQLPDGFLKIVPVTLPSQWVAENGPSADIESLMNMVFGAKEALDDRVGTPYVYDGNLTLVPVLGFFAQNGEVTYYDEAEDSVRVIQDNRIDVKGGTQSISLNLTILNGFGGGGYDLKSAIHSAFMITSDDEQYLNPETGGLSDDVLYATIYKGLAKKN